MVATVNFTGAIDPDLLQRAKVIAAKSDTSLDALVSVQLRQVVETFEAADEGRNANYATLLAFSLGRIDDQAAMRQLGLDDDEDFFLLMAQARLPMPRLPQAETTGMVQALHRLGGA